MPAFPQMGAAYAEELADGVKCMSSVRLAVAAMVDAHRRTGLEFPVNAAGSETLRSLAR